MMRGGERGAQTLSLPNTVVFGRPCVVALLEYTTDTMGPTFALQPHFFHPDVLPHTSNIATRKMYFHPNNSRWSRGIVLLSSVACTATGLHVLMGDFGTQAHVFTPVQQYLTPKIDEFFGISGAEIALKVKVKRVPLTSIVAVKPASK